MRMDKKSLVVIGISMGIITLVILIAVAVRDNLGLISQFRSFTVTIDNQSDYDLVTIEAGILTSDLSGKVIEGSSKEIFEHGIQSGDKVKLTPKLSLMGEGGIYLKYTDSRGEIIRKSVCSYTESLSGYSKVTITNDNVTVNENCN